jgi:hypothetical protein
MIGYYELKNMMKVKIRFISQGSPEKLSKQGGRKGEKLMRIWLTQL